MPIDPRGTTPGLSPQAKLEEKVINMKCRNRKCTSITATEIKIQNKSQRVYRCTECGNTWFINVGGNIDI